MQLVSCSTCRPLTNAGKGLTGIKGGGLRGAKPHAGSGGASRAGQAMTTSAAPPSPTCVAEDLARLLTRFAENRHRSAQCKAPWAASQTASEGRRRLHAVAFMPGGVLAVTASQPLGQEEDLSEFTEWCCARKAGAKAIG